MSCLMVMAGGTGGHVFPALAVANVLRGKGVEIVWLGTRKGLESTIVPANDIAIEWVSVEGLRGKGLGAWFKAPFNLIRAMWQSGKAIRKINPDCVLGMGGFVAGPGGLVARMMGKPVVVHEQNAVAGMTNQYLAKIATRVLTGFPKVESLPKSSVWVGNPVRKDIANVAESQEVNNKQDTAIKILVIGGSQGAHSFNKYLPKVFNELQMEVDVWHQTGKGRDSDVIDAYATLGMSVKVTEFIEDMAQAYAWADVLVCRSGAMTVAESCAAAKPALFIPYPFSAGDHQVKNAQALVDINAALMMSNQELAQSADKPQSDILINLTKLLSDKETLTKMGNAAKTLYKPDALDDVVEVCEEYLNA